MFDYGVDGADAYTWAAREAAEGTRRWYVVQTHAHKELTAQTHLERQQFAVFLPQIRKTLRIRRQSSEVLRPLFPRYMFISLDLAMQGWRCVRSTVGVSSLIMEGDRPRPVPRGLVEELRARSSPSEGVRLEAALAVGDSVRFVRGPFAERIGRLLELKDAERAVVLLDMLGAERPVIADVSQLLPSRAGR